MAATAATSDAVSGGAAPAAHVAPAPRGKRAQVGGSASGSRGVVLAQSRAAKPSGRERGGAAAAAPAGLPPLGGAAAPAAAAPADVLAAAANAAGQRPRGRALPSDPQLKAEVGKCGP